MIACLYNYHLRIQDLKDRKAVDDYERERQIAREAQTKRDLLVESREAEMEIDAIVQAGREAPSAPAEGQNPAQQKATGEPLPNNTRIVKNHTSIFDHRSKIYSRAHMIGKDPACAFFEGKPAAAIC